ncbi:hypothetical protein CAAN1_11S04632 [[Candida] anglica]|uniref:Pali-domain-containing protein n=1 Tax=[Candida] anglica TaxID=148631 RepID=A0ABP0EHS6_9ASCO
MGASIGLGSVAVFLQVVALAFLILAIISVPVVKSLSLGSTSNYTYGVFGYCNGSDCIKATYPWVPSQVKDNVRDWAMSSSARDSLAKILIIGPIAAGLVFFSVIFSLAGLFATHIVGVIALVVAILAFLTTAVICIAVVMLFFPHVSWTGWILVGAAAAMLISIPLLLLATKYGSYEELENDSSSREDLTRFEDYGEESKFGYVPPPQSQTLGGGFPKQPNTYADTTTSSISREYDYKPVVTTLGNGYNPTTTRDNNSIYNANPQKTFDFTQKEGVSSAPTRPAYVAGQSGTGSSTSNYYSGEDKVSLVNGPNTPVSSQRNMAPTIVPTVATPTLHDAPLSKVPAVPYPVSTYGSPNDPVRTPYNPTVFEHHPEVEGHKPFTELRDDDVNKFANEEPPIDSDTESDFTSVSQRAPNPQYYQGNSPERGHAPPPPPHVQQFHLPQQQPHLVRVPMMQQHQQQPLQIPPQQHYQQQQQQQQPYSYGQSAYSTPAPPPPPPHGPSSNIGYFNQVPPPQQQQQRGPTVADSVLNNNPDFAIGGGFKKNNRQNMSNIARGPRRLSNSGMPAASMTRDGPYSFR